MSLTYPGPIKYGDHGRRVKALKRAMVKAGFREHFGHTDTFGIKLRNQLINFQKHHGIVKERGHVGPHTWDKLVPYFKRDGYARWLINHAPAPKDTKLDIRKLIVKNAWYGYYHGASVHYQQRRPMPLSWDFPIWTDCSGYATLCYYKAGAPDPNGLQYSGYGFTGSMWVHGNRVATPSLGDLVFYYNPDHVATYVGGGKVISFGSEYGPYFLDAHYRYVGQYRSYV